MLKKTLCLILCVLCLVSLTSCSKPNRFGLSLATDGSDKMDYIYYEDEFAVYVVGGIMTAEVDGSAKLLDLALSDGDIKVSDILSVAEADVENEDIERVGYPDGSVEYKYENFTLVRLNTYDGKRDVYFVPTSMGYYDVAN